MPAFKGFGVICQEKKEQVVFLKKKILNKEYVICREGAYSKRGRERILPRLFLFSRRRSEKGKDLRDENPPESETV